METPRSKGFARHLLIQLFLVLEEYDRDEFEGAGEGGLAVSTT
jgi:hypothetical protein